MNATYKTLITVSIFFLSLPVLADDKVSNVSITFFDDYGDILKSIIPLIVAIVTAGVAIFVTKIARKAPDAAVKLEQLKFIEGLVYDKAWSKPESYFVVEEAFKLYYKTYIPIDIIKLLANVEERFFAFSYYANVGGLISFDKQRGKIKSLSEKGKNLRIGALLSLGIMFLHFCFISFVLAIFLFSKSNFLGVALGCIFTIFFIFFGWAAYSSFDNMIDLKANFRRFESKLEGKFEATEINTSDMTIIIFSIIIIVILWLAFLCINYF
ncbi:MULTISPECIES: hypothetical protein [unclassified Pseudoalteromonas]|uniref:hypothetical protein n=1 Tax=Pseudoalteromonas TaxID=53246 RepID=UPI003324E6DF